MTSNDFPLPPCRGLAPRTEAALETAAKDRHLVETHVLELKRELPPGGDSANKELARDLASLAIDGGLLIIGVDEDKDYALTPVPLDGLAERVEQVAGSRIDEPLPLTFFEIESAAKPSDGYLLARVPASPRAPHMVDNRYWGRGDKTKYMLSDAQVERLIAQRARWAVNAETALNDWIAADPIALDQRQNAHLFVIADPVPPRERLLLPVLGVGDWTAAFRTLVTATTNQGGATFAPDMTTHLSYFSTTADGWAWKSYAVFGQRDEGEQGRERERGALIVEVCENGQLRMMCGRATEDYNGKRLMIDDLVLGLTARMVSLAEGVSHAAGFLGSWDFGVGVTMLKGAISHRRYTRDGFGFPGPPYTADNYSATTRASLAEIERGTGPVVERLLGHLYRAVGADQVAEVKRHFTQQGPED
jgi:hypothetical protein